MDCDTEAEARSKPAPLGRDSADSGRADFSCPFVSGASIGRTLNPGGPGPFFRFFTMFLPNGEGKALADGGDFDLETEGPASAFSVASVGDRRRAKEGASRVGDSVVE